MNIQAGMTFEQSPGEFWRIVAVVPHPEKNRAFVARISESNERAIYACFESPNPQEELKFFPLFEDKPTRIVLAEEVEKAFFEGRDSIHTSPPHREDSFAVSRAKRVMEGLE